eukprot:280297-Karenia_brevis.AAC.1
MKCRFAATTGCTGGNPYAAQLMPKENTEGPNIHPTSAWQNPIVSLLHSSSSLSPSSSQDLPSSLISPGVTKECVRLGVTGRPKDADIEMEDAGQPSQPQTTPAADAFIQKTQEHQRAQQIYQDLLEKLGEDDLA